MYGDPTCIKCHNQRLKIMYERIAVVPEGESPHSTPYGKGRRKQKFARIGVICGSCGNVFLEPAYMKKVMDSRKQNRKYFPKTFPKGKPGVFEFIQYERDSRTSKLVRVKNKL